MIDTIIFATIVGIVTGLIGVHFPQPPYAKRFSDWLGAWVKEKFGNGVWFAVKQMLGMK